VLLLLEHDWKQEKYEGGACVDSSFRILGILQQKYASGLASRDWSASTKV